MNKYEFNATNLIAETFEKRGFKFEVNNHHGMEELQTFLPIGRGSYAIMHFISHDNDNDVAVRIIGLVSDVPMNKRLRVMEVCNALNINFRYLKFTLDGDGDVNVEYDFLVRSPNEGIGEMAFEIFSRTIQILSSENGIFMKAIYSDEDLDIQNDSDTTRLMQRLEEIRRRIEARMTATSVSDDDDQSDSESDDVELDVEDSELVSSSDDIAC